MNFVSAEQDNLDMMLTQMGAQVKSIHGIICFAKFLINGTEFFYVYNINAKSQYYLQKVLPYPVGAGEFSRPSEIIAYIKNDIEKFKNASKNSTFEDFLKVNTKIHRIVHKLEDTFMNYKLEPQELEKIYREIEDVDNILDDAQKTSDKR